VLSNIEAERLREWGARLREAPKGRKAEVVEQACTALGCSDKTLYRKLKAAGFESGRRRRSDAGDCVLTDEQLNDLAGVLLSSYNQKDQRMPIQTALDMVRHSFIARGESFPLVSASTVSRQLYARKLHPTQLSQPTEHVQLVSKHPNHVWQVDSTTGAYYYLPNGRLRWMDEAEFNKNKLANMVKASSALLTRYAAVDHTTHAFKVRYYLGGESAENLINFLVWAMWKQDAGPMCGVPLILMTDQGPANKSAQMKLFCKRLGIRHEMHAPGAARVTGSVEKSHDLARMHLETRYNFTNPESVTLNKLNLDAEAWAAALCSTRKHTRHGRTRYAAWMEISRYPHALRMPASEQALRDAASSEPRTTRLRNDRRLSFDGRKYLLDRESVPHAIPGQMVTFVLNVFRAPAIDVQFVCPDTGEVRWYVVEPERADEWGYGAGPVIGEGYASPQNTVLDDNRNALRKQAYRTGDALPTLDEAKRLRKLHAQAYADKVDPLADVKATEVPAYLPRRSTPLALPERRVEARRLNLVEAAKMLKTRLGDAYTPQVYSDLTTRFGVAGVPEDQIDALAREFQGSDGDAGAARAAGGGA